MSATPWAEMMRRAAVIGVGPAAFWRLSLNEWRWLAGPCEVVPMTGADLAKLAARWPDADLAREDQDERCAG